MATSNENIVHDEWPTLRAIRAQLPDLGAAEQRTGKAILDNPEAAIHESVGELADRAATSTATVIRLSRRIGFDGFTALKIALAHEAGRASAFGHPPQAGQTTRSLLEEIFDDEIDALQHAVLSIDHESFGRAVDALVLASEIAFVGVGTSNHLAHLAAYRFASLGKRVTALGDVLSQHLAIDTLGERAAIVAISHTGASDHTCLLASQALARGLTVVGLTSTARSPLTDIADYSITTGHNIKPHRLDNFASRTDHVATLAALHAAVASQLGDAEARGAQAAQLLSQHQR